MGEESEKKDKAERKSLRDLIGSRNWIKTVEETVEKKLKTARSSVDSAVESAVKRLKIPSQKDYDMLLKRIQALESKVQKLEGVKKVRAPRSKKKVEEKGGQGESDST
ncbi:MAG TPA: phasin family protein [Thermodesulfobacteriota bacterium]|nr:phasin family protein [Thermodesulfobacteriota bacterium]